jgi:hypothetical protein
MLALKVLGLKSFSDSPYCLLAIETRMAIYRVSPVFFSFLFDFKNDDAAKQAILSEAYLFPIEMRPIVFKLKLQPIRGDDIQVVRGAKRCFLDHIIEKAEECFDAHLVTLSIRSVNEYSTRSLSLTRTRMMV